MKVFHYLGHYLCKSIVVRSLLYVLCVYDATDHNLPVVLIFFFFCLTAVYTQYSSLLNPQLKDCCSSTTHHTLYIITSVFFQKGCLKDKSIILHLKLLFKKTGKNKSHQKIFRNSKERKPSSVIV